MSELLIAEKRDLVAVANAIREKTGLQDKLTFPDGFVEAVGGIEVGGSGASPSASWNDVTFIDYDGAVLYSYTVDEAQALADLPPLPEHEGLICQGWNYDLATIKEYNRPVTVGAMYITDDGKTRIYITLHEGRTSPMLGVCPNGTVTVDWGDGTEPDVLTGTSVSTVQWTPTHNYAAPGDYVISLTVDVEMGVASGNNGYSTLMRHSETSNSLNTVYQNSIKKIELGANVTRIGTHAFRGCRSLEYITIPAYTSQILTSYALQDCDSLNSITIPNGATNASASALNGCFGLKSVSLPDGVTSIGDSAFSGCSTLARIVLPKSITTIGKYFMYKCTNLERIDIPEGVVETGIYTVSDCTALTSVGLPNTLTELSTDSFKNCTSLTHVVVPKSVTTVYGGIFNGCTALRFIDFSLHESVPSLVSASLLTSRPSDLEIRVPAALYDEWIAATNWSTHASYIVAV